MCHKTRLRGGKNWTPIFLAYLTPNKVKKTIKSILARTFNFRHISDIPHQTITSKPGPLQTLRGNSFPYVNTKNKRFFFKFGWPLIYWCGTTILFECPEDPAPRRMYLLPKIHKDRNVWPGKGEVPTGRPIIADCGNESYASAEYIDHVLALLAKQHKAYLNDTNDFINKIAGIKAQKRHVKPQ